MKLFAFQPNGHGPKSFFVMAENRVDAFKAVDLYIVKNKIDDYDRQGFYTGDYKVTELIQNEVIENDND